MASLSLAEDMNYQGQKDRTESFSSITSRDIRPTTAAMSIYNDFVAKFLRNSQFASIVNWFVMRTELLLS